MYLPTLYAGCSMLEFFILSETFVGVKSPDLAVLVLSDVSSEERSRYFI